MEMEQQENKNFRLAVLIDAENAPRTAIREIMAECVKYGTPTVKRIYGDWAQDSMDSWKDLLLENAIIPIQQYSYTTGKNSSDIALVIDAMDILYDNQVEGFVLVSSDSDFTRLALRLREAGKTVYGIGEQKTPMAFIRACDKFIYAEIIRGKLPTPPVVKETSSAPAKGEKSVPPEMVELIATAIKDGSDEDGWIFLGVLGNILIKRQPDFDPRNYGYDKLMALVRSVGRFEIDSRPTSSPSVKNIYVRDKKAREA